jgi:predicted O-methyltransferase YrrM
MKKLIESAVSIPLFGYVFLFLIKCRVASYYLIPANKNFFRWLLFSREITNFTFDLNSKNKLYLAMLISEITKQPIGKIQNYIQELENDEFLKEHLKKTIQKSNQKYFADEEIFYGKRLGWYAFTRALKPRLVVETGVDKGLGSCVLAAAILRNRKEGFFGEYRGTDINPAAGYLFTGEYSKAGKILYGDSIQSLKKIKGKIDLFINDSDHSAEYEMEEYRTIQSKLSKGGIILGDNSHATDKLLQFSLKTKRKFTFFREEPKNHWYPGGGIGISFPAK